VKPVIGTVDLTWLTKTKRLTRASIAWRATIEGGIDTDLAEFHKQIGSRIIQHMYTSCEMDNLLHPLQ
jgi:hypothetical protein